MNKNYSLSRTRFAPSPTGMLHVGGARTALFNYLFSKKDENGDFILRVEDTDIKRSSDFYAEKQYQDLSWLQLFPDESPFNVNSNSSYSYRQSERIDHYEKHLKTLLNEKKAYFCFCSETDLKKEKDEYFLNSGRRNYKYSRKCFYLEKEEIEKRISNHLPFSVRFLVNNKKDYEIDDGVRGKVVFSGQDIEDFVIVRKDKTPLLNFAVVVDDHEMGITHVIRAEEHLTNTSKQLALYEGFEWNPPSFFHISIIVNSEKKKISKRDKTSNHFIIENLRNLGYLPQAINNCLFFLGFNPLLKGSEILSLDEMLKLFDPNRFNSRPSVFSIEKLNWFNSQWIKKMSDEEFKIESRKFLSEYLKFQNVDEVAKVFKEQINCFSDLLSLVGIFFCDQQFLVETDRETKDLIELLHRNICNLSNWEKDSIEDNVKIITKHINEKEKKRKFLVSIRKILSGVEKGPEIATLIYLMGRDKVAKNISKFIENGSKI